jgi:hypothetical protein
MATREYTNQSQSGTVYKSAAGKSPTDQLTDRVMMIAHRVVDLEKKVDLILQQVAKLGLADADLKKQIEEVSTTQASSLVQQATAKPSPRPARRRKSTAKVETEATKETTATTEETTD